MPIDRYVVDFAKTFGGATLIGVEAKLTRADRNDPKSQQVQAHDGNGSLKWRVTVVVQTKAFESTRYETIPITITSPNKPYTAIPIGSQVTVEGLELGIMAQSRGGFSVFYSAEAIRTLQPARVASGQ